MESSANTHGSARPTNLENQEDSSTSSLLELVPSLEHSIVGILNNNGELAEQDQGTGHLGYLVKGN